jgi:NDP-sugar pyrophosphorylase family protein
MRKAFLLGAGLGTRLRPMTAALPKPLIPVFHRPLITHALDHCLAAGLSDFAINTHHLPQSWPATFPDSTYRDAPLSFFHEDVLLETGGGIKNIDPWIGDEVLLVYNGDILTDLPLETLLATHAASGNKATLALRSEGPNCNVAVDGDRVVDLRHARGINPGTHQFTGIYIVEPDVLPLLPKDEKISVVPALLEFAAQGSLGACVLDDGYWLDLGTRESYLDAHQPDTPGPQGPAIDPSASIDPSALVVNSIVGPGCQVGPNAQLLNSLLWPNTTVNADAQLTDCILYSSTPATGHHHNSDL